MALKDKKLHHLTKITDLKHMAERRERPQSPKRVIPSRHLDWRGASSRVHAEKVIIINMIKIACPVNFYVTPCSPYSIIDDIRHIQLSWCKGKSWWRLRTPQASQMTYLTWLLRLFAGSSSNSHFNVICESKSIVHSYAVWQFALSWWSGDNW